MKFVLAFFALVAAPAFAAPAPDSLAGKVFRDYVRLDLDHSAWEDTVVLQADGHFVFLKAAAANSLAPVPGDFRVSLSIPPGDGTFVYSRIDETNGRLTLNFDGGTHRSWNLAFTSSNAGSTMTLAPNEGVSEFYLTDFAAANSAPLLNFSLRGQARPGRPLIAGFVVPGQGEREIMIRAVGPGLAAFNVGDPWAAPDFQVFRGSAPAILKERHNTGPAAAALQRATAFVGAFPLAAAASDTADIVRLAPGSYTVVCAPAAADPGGEVLIEAYVLP